MNPPSVDIKDYFEDSANSIGTFGQDLFIGNEPDAPDNCMTIFDTGGENSEVNYVYDRPTVMVRVRGAVDEYVIAYNKAAEIKSLLHGKTGLSINSTRYIGVWLMGDVFYNGRDEKNRPIFSVNFLIHRTPA